MIRSMRSGTDRFELVRLLQDATAGKRGVTLLEIGSYRGESASLFLSTGLVDRIYCVDPWEGGFDKTDDSSSDDYTAVEAAFDERHGKDSRVVKIKGTLSDFIDKYGDGDGNVTWVDVVYVDGCHSYSCVISDLRRICSHVRPRMAIAGHDYGMRGVRDALRETLGDPQRHYKDDSWILKTGDDPLPPDGATSSRSAVVWSSDGGDHEYMRYSVASMRNKVGDSCDFYVLADPKADLHGIDRIYGVTRIDPTPYLKTVGFTESGYNSLNRNWHFTVLYRLLIPLIGRFQDYSVVLYLDGDTYAVPDSLRSPLDLLRRPLSSVEVAGVPDMYILLFLRNADFLKGDVISGEMREELTRRVWAPSGTEVRSYVNGGVLAWYPRNIDREWYVRRCRYFWSNIQSFTFNDQDFVNYMLRVDSALLPIYNSEFTGGGSYIVDDACIRHCTGPAKAQMILSGQRVPGITQDAIFSQCPLHPRKTPLSSWSRDGRKCVVWCCNGDPRYVNMTEYAVRAFREQCNDSLDKVDLFVLSDGGYGVSQFSAIGVKVLEVSELVTGLGLRTVDDWRSGRLWWSCGKAIRFVIPFVKELRGYDTCLYMDADTYVVDPAFFSVFDRDLSGYDCAMAGEFTVQNGLYREFYRVRFAKSFVRARNFVGHDDANAILSRLNAGIYFNAGVMLINMPELREAFRNERYFAEILFDSVSRGAPAVWHDLYNYFCRIQRLEGRYNTFYRTHEHGDSVYCVHVHDGQHFSGTYPAVKKTDFT